MGTKAATKTGESQKGRMAVRHMAAMPYQNKGKGGITTKSRPKANPKTPPSIRRRVKKSLPKRSQKQNKQTGSCHHPKGAPDPQTVLVIQDSGGGANT